MRARFRRLRWKLTWSYTWVAALTFFILETVLLILLLTLLGVNPLEAGTGYLHEELLPGLADTILPITAFHLRQNPTDRVALQADLDQTMSDMPPAIASRPFDSTHIYSIFVLDGEQKLLASVPRYALLPPDGRRFDAARLTGDDTLDALLAAVYAGDDDFPQPMVHTAPQALYLVTAVPVQDASGRLRGVQLAIIRSPTPRTLLLLGVAIILGGLTLFSLAAATIGTLFGWRMARKLSRRLAHLSQTTAAWGQGDFARHVQDVEADEIGALGQNLNRVADELQALLAAKEEMAVLEERERMARELHDTLAQGVAGLVLQLEAVKHHLNTTEILEAQMIVTDAAAQARDALHKARAAIDDLRAAALFAPDFIAAVTQQTQKLMVDGNMTVELDAQLPDSLLLPPTVARHARRALAELLANVAQHAEATAVTVQLRQVDGSLLITVVDNGVGFAVATAVRPGHYGLIGLKERARLTAGHFTIASEAGKGTTAQLRLPLGRSE